MKKLICTILLSFLLFLASCKSAFTISSPITEKAPDTISKPTTTLVAKETVGELPKDTIIKTDSEEKLEVKLENDTLVTVLPNIPETPEIKSENVKMEEIGPPKVAALESNFQIILPKNTSVVIPENTYLQVTDPSKVKIDAQTEVILPTGTEISITRVNWYAILFYCLLVISLGYYYLRSSKEDADGDGYVDTKKRSKS
jgi:hypothetical protein